MPQNDFTIANANGATVRADVNSALQALASQNSGASAPATTYANEFWHDDTNDQMKIRDEANTVWIIIASKIGTTWIPYYSVNPTGNMSLLSYTAINQNLTMSGKSVIMASAAITSGTPDFATNAGNTVSITSTATANTLGTVQAGFIAVIHYGVAITVTHNATSRILPTGANLPMSVGDVEIALSLGSGNWRTIAVMRASGLGLIIPTPQAKTGSYTVTDADRGSVIRFSGLSADATLTLPAASGRAGFEFTLSCEQVFADGVVNTAPFGVIVDPNASEQIDGFTTRKTFGKSRITIVCDGTGWYTKSGHWLYFSGNQSLTAAGTFTLAHGLGVRPSRVWYCYQCVTADVNYTQYDIVYTNADATDGGFNLGHGCVPDATNLTVRIAATGTWMLNKTTGGVALVTAANWKLQLYAEA